MKSICYIVGAGEFSGIVKPTDEMFIIAADAGYKTLTEVGITPDLVVGDFDSLGKAPKHPNILTVPAEKDDTDMSLAVKCGLKNGCKTFLIDGGMGGRLDHTLANIQLLKEIKLNNAHGVLLGKDMTLAVIKDETIRFPTDAKGLISIFAMGEKAEAVTIEGLKYSLDEETLTDNYPIGVSNEFTGKPTIISVTKGSLIITWESRAMDSDNIVDLYT